MVQIAELEALLFVVGEEGVSLNELSFFLNDTTDEIYNSIQLLNQNYVNASDSALTIIELAGRFVLSTKSKYSSLLKEFSKSPISSKLSQASLEVLSIIAYRQPITRIKIEEIRGVSSSSTITKLVNLGLVNGKERDTSMGKPILYSTTNYFMNYFGLKNLDELPELKDIDKDIVTESLDIFFDKNTNK